MISDADILIDFVMQELGEINWNNSPHWQPFTQS